jgi:NAD(P)H-hydrate epimerase
MSIPITSRALYTVDQVRRIDQAAINHCGIPGFVLMQRAAAAAFALLLRRWPQARRIVVLAGHGNNGGDAFLLAQLARAEGLHVTALALGEESRGDAEIARAAFVKDGGIIGITDLSTVLPDADVYVDGLFGTGLTRSIDGVAAALIAQLVTRYAAVLALDIPSGLNADTGVAEGPVVRADTTISFVGWKRGLFTADAADRCGVLELAALDIPEAAFTGIAADAGLLDRSIASLLVPRGGNVNKGSFGHVLAIGGDEGMAGAVRLAAEAALRVGAGLVSVATRAAHIGALNAARPELMARAVDGPQSIESMLARASVLAVGPGLGQGAWGHALWDAALRSGRSIVLDADGLNLLARDLRSLPSSAILTPHPGEAARLLECDIAAIQRDRFGAARALAARYRAVVVLKGAGSLIADAEGRVAVCPFGNPGMASGGMGDVLTGVIAGLLAQGLDAWDAACLGVVAHAVAGDAAAGLAPRGLIASDLFEPLREFVNGRLA